MPPTDAHGAGTSALAFLPRRGFLAGALAVAVAGCDLPRDAGGTLNRIRSGRELRVGVSENPPWVRFEGDAAGGIEPALMSDWGERLGARPVWFRGSEPVLFQALRERVLDIVIAGLTRDNPWSPKLAISRTYLVARVRFGMPSERSVPGTWSGQRIGFDRRRVWVEALVRSRDAVPEHDRATAVAVAGYDFEIEAQGLAAVGPVLAEEQHVVAAVPGESALLLALDRFLAEKDEQAMRRFASRFVA
jgi:hypothetical protein